MSTEDQHDYVSALRLRSLPFESGTDSDIFFADPALTQRLDHLQHLIHFGGLILVIEGEVGSGKTVFLRQLINRAGENWKVCRIQGDANHVPLEVVRQIARQFELDDGGHPDDLKRSIFDYCQVMARTSQVPVVLVDDADRLPLAVLGQILTIGGSPEETARQLRIVLFGAPGLQYNLVKAGICNDASLIHSVIMHPFDEAQTDAYLVYRLSVAGFSGASPFSSIEVRAIHKSASGLPSRINRLAHQTLMEHMWAVPRADHDQQSASPFYQKMIPANLTSEGKWLAAGVTAILAAGVLWLIGPSPEPANGEAGALLTEQLTIPASDKRLSEFGRADSGQAPIGLEEPVMESPVTEAALVDNGMEESEPRPLLLPVPIRPPETSTAVVSDETVTPKTENRVAAAMVEPDTQHAGLAAVTEAVEPVPAPEPVSAVRSSAMREISKNSDQPVVTEAATNKLEVRGESWLLNQSPGAVTVQLLGVSKESSVKRFLDQHQFREPTAYFHIIRNGKPWYVLVHGVYPDRNSAKAAIASFSKELRTAKPWPRTFASIQTDIQPSASP